MKHVLGLLLSIYVIVHAPGNDYSAAYSGMSQDDIASSLKDPFEFVDKPTYDAFVSAHAPVHTTDSTRNAQKLKAQQDIKNKSLTQAQRLQALLILLDFDR